MITDMPRMSNLEIFKQQNPNMAAQMKQWGNSSQPISTIGNREWSQEGADKAQAVLDGVGSFIPFMGQEIAAKDYANAMENNDSIGGVLAAAQMVPIFGGTAKLGSSFLGGRSAYALKQMRRGSQAEQAMEKGIKYAPKASNSANIIQFGQDVTQ